MSHAIFLCVLRVSQLLVFPCSFASGTARARSFYSHERSRTTESTDFEDIHHKDRRQLQLFQRLALRRGRASFCDICQHTSSQPPFAGLSVAPWNKDDMGDGVPTGQLSHNHCDCTDSHCNSHIVTSCVFVLELHSHHKSIGGRLLFPQAARDGLALCHLSRQDTSRGVPSSGQASEQGVCVQKVAGASPHRWDHGAPTGQRGLPGRGDNVFVHTPIKRPAA